MRTDGRTDRRTDMTKLIVAFRNFAIACKKTILKAGLDSAVGIATCFGLDGQGFETRGWRGARLSAPVQTGPGAHTASYTVGTEFLLRVMRPGHGVAHPPSYNAEVKERVQLYI